MKKQKLKVVGKRNTDVDVYVFCQIYFSQVTKCKQVVARFIIYSHCQGELEGKM